jgi:hypothetical protein
MNYKTPRIVASLYLGGIMVKVVSKYAIDG